MREIVLDTETTGLDPDTGDRIVEIGALELINHVPTGQTFHRYIDPERPMPQEAFAVHGLGDDFLKGKPVFAAVVDEFLAFIAQSPLVIHNASFDMKFLNAELKRQDRPQIPMSRAVDTLAIARSRFPGSPASLDALCRRFGIDNSVRTKHGALLDSEILAEVYLELIGGRQPGLVLSTSGGVGAAQAPTGLRQPLPRRERPLTPRRTADEAEAHAEFIAAMGESAIWRRFS
jgi:DNA polymerase III subunit epsilon